MSSRSCGEASLCKNRSYDRRWMSIRFGISTWVAILEKSLRSITPSVIDPAMHAPFELAKRNVGASFSAEAARGRCLSPYRGAQLHAPTGHTLLLDLDLRAHLFQLLPHRFGFFLRDPGLHRLRHRLHEVFGLLQPEAGQFPNHLDELHLFVGRHRREDDIERRLLLDRRRGRAPAG